MENTLIFKQILPTNSSVNVQKSVLQICIWILGLKELNSPLSTSIA